ncbi:hypothetical protein W02_23920 [Nitrospira sp. KM1]|uniref:hypothetical protein n=1 Tax=Nitrospira sp. KM1 TaxID=1936990 RepID=UPI0013A71906|nr:hypothetical protein [Nitrospira sp. KM1]BCA55252.1 hypothetical protein W02_23920 [Nitrospira sp. KM1]
MMTPWEKPVFTEVRMDAEINGYQDEFEDVPDIRPISSQITVVAPDDKAGSAA